MSSSSRARPNASALLLREFAEGCSSFEDLCKRFKALPFAETQLLLRDLALLLETLPAAELQGSPDDEALPDIAVETPRPFRQSCFEFDPAVGPTSSTQRSSQESTLGTRKLLLYSDGASRGNPGPAGAGAVLMKPDGTIVARIGKYLGRQTNNHAEYMALILGLRTALELGTTEIEMSADSELMVKQIKKIYRVKNERIKDLYDEATKLIARFQRASIRHVPREYNQEADEMSNRAIDERM